MGNSGPSYPEDIVAPYREELVSAGFEQMLTPEDVESVLDKNDDKVTMVILNSVCGCSARVGRPGALLSLFNEVVPDELATLFAGMEKEAVAHFRQKYLPGLTPSSPNIAVFKNGKLVHILHRHQIESSSAQQISDALSEVYDAICTKNNSEDAKEKLRGVFIENYQADPLNLPTQ